MARLIRQWPLLHHHCLSYAALNYLLSDSFTLSTKSISHRVFSTKVTASNRSVRFRSRGPKLPNSPTPSDFEQGGNVNDSESEANKSRNQKKREARRSVRWGMELASFSPLQIKRIIKVASLDKDVFDALTLVKRLGPDVREGKRRQYNYIGKLLRDIEPELMDALIHCTKDGDWSRLQGFSGLEGKIIGDDNEEYEESEYEAEEEVSYEYIDVATRWFDGLINKDIKITNEVYALRSVYFDRQELRKLVRKVHAAQERKGVAEENEQEVDTAITVAKKSLTRFLHGLAKQMPSEPNHIDLTGSAIIIDLEADLTRTFLFIPNLDTSRDIGGHSLVGHEAIHSLRFNLYDMIDSYKLMPYHSRLLKHCYRFCLWKITKHKMPISFERV